MPDHGQVAVAAYRVMRLRGLAGVTLEAVREMMITSGVRPGSNRDLPEMIRAWKREQERLTELPPHIVELAQGFAKTVWEIAFATNNELELQRGGDDAVRERPPLSKKVRGKKRFELLRKVVEFLLRPDAKKSLVKEPLSAQEIFRRLTDRQSSLTDEDHIDRDLGEAAKLSDILYRLPNKQWWRSDRPLPANFGPEGRRRRTYVRRGTPASATRTANEPRMNDAVDVLSKAGQGMTGREIADELEIQPRDRSPFLEMLRNHLRAKEENLRFRKVGGKYVIFKKKKS